MVRRVRVGAVQQLPNACSASRGISAIAATSPRSILSVAPSYTSWLASAGTASAPQLRAATASGMQACGPSNMPTIKPPTSGFT